MCACVRVRVCVCVCVCVCLSLVLWELEFSSSDTILLFLAILGPQHQSCITNHRAGRKPPEITLLPEEVVLSLLLHVCL